MPYEDSRFVWALSFFSNFACMKNGYGTIELVLVCWSACTYDLLFICQFLWLHGQNLEVVYGRWDAN